MHEVRELGKTIAQLRALLRSQGRMLIAEPKGHVSQEAFDATLQTCAEVGFEVVTQPRIRRSLTALLQLGQ